MALVSPRLSEAVAPWSQLHDDGESTISLEDFSARTRQASAQLGGGTGDSLAHADTSPRMQKKVRFSEAVSMAVVAEGSPIDSDYDPEMGNDMAPSAAHTTGESIGGNTRWVWIGASLLALFVIVVLALAILTHRRFTPPRGVLDPIYRPVILISLDGFRADYFGRVPTPNLDRIASAGARASYMTSVFPSLTFPNHYSLVTGLTSESHGITFNTMYSPEFNAYFSISDPDAVSDARWWGGEPVWNSNARAGGRSGVYFWPGSEAPIGGMRPDYWVRYNGSVPYAERVDTLLGWLDAGEAKRPSLLLLYMSAVDSAGHAYGPDSVEVESAIGEVDAAVGRLLAGLDARGLGLDAHATVIVVSDHGMAALSPNRTFALDGMLAAAAPFLSGPVNVLTYSPVTQFWAASDADAAVLVAAAAPLLAAYNYTVYARADVPERFHFRTSDRIPAAIGVAPVEWTALPSAADAASLRGGAHGYDPEAAQMRAIFLAAGPRIRQRLALGAVRNLDVYELLCELLRVAPAPNNGSRALIDELLM